MTPVFVEDKVARLADNGFLVSISIPSFLLICGYPALSKVRTYSIVKRELGPNLLNRALNDEGWLTHLSAGVVSQSGISSANPPPS